jgi:membrane protein involved in colicin uptake
MAEAESNTAKPVPETSHSHGAHGRVKRGYWPEKFGEQEVTIDVDHPQADKVRTRQQLRAEQIAAEKAEREAKKAAEKAQREADEKAKRDAEQRSQSPAQ